MSFNEDIYSHIVRRVTTNNDDYKWLCNQLSRAYKTLQSPIDNARCSKSIGGKWDRKYQIQIEHGCCGFYDKEITNPKTGNKFFVGFNYGH